MAFPPSSSSHCTMVNRMLWASDRSGMEKSEEQFFPGGVSMGTGQGWSHVTRSSRRILQLLDSAESVRSVQTEPPYPAAVKRSFVEEHMPHESRP